MSKLSIAIISCLLCAAAVLGDGFERTYEISPLHVDRDTFIGIVNEAFTHVASVNRPEETRGEIELGGLDQKVNLDLPVQTTDYRKFPSVAYEANIRIVSTKGAVNTVNISLNDTYRQITVKGLSQDHVSGVINVIREKIQLHETMLGGIGARFTLAAIFYISIILIATINWLGLTFRSQAMVYGVALVISQIVIYLPPWKTIFPGFLASSPNQSFLERYSPHFTFLGLLLAIIVPIIGAVSKRRNLRNNATTPDAQ